MTADRPTLITGGAGFVGTNLAARILADGGRVLLLDSLARPGVEQNLRWLRDGFGDRVEVAIADLRDADAVAAAAARAGAVYHFAAQVAVTTSLADPLDDFEVNARGTLTLLEALRRLEQPPPLLFTSTNKVYGSLADVPLRLAGARYEPEDPDVRRSGVPETRALEFYSPYGCSKGTADQYVVDYARTFGLPAVVFRMSCIYGPHQFGNEDQGWVAHFLIRALEGRPIVLYGDGRQVRDVLFVDDLVEALRLAVERVGALRGRAFNIGGGPERSVSLLELIDLIGELLGRPPAVAFDAWRPGDQHYYVSDTSAFNRATGWRPRVGVREGVERLWRWLRAHRTAAAQAPAVLARAAQEGAAGAA